MAGRSSRACVAAAVCLVLGCVIGSAGSTSAGSSSLEEFDLVGPPGSVCFGNDAVVLGNGNVVVTDPCWNNGFGAVYMFDGHTRAVVSTLTGSRITDGVGSGGVTVLANGDYVVSSPGWSEVDVPGVGAVTWGDETVGASGVIAPSNSMVGSHSGDSVGGVVALPNGNFVVTAPQWDNGSVVDAGAVRLAGGSAATVGPMTASNSLVGSTTRDLVGLSHMGNMSAVVPLTNGNYVVLSQFWDNGPVLDAGAVTWASGSSGVVGPVSSANSLVGSSAHDEIGYNILGGISVVALSNGNYVVASPFWDDGTAANAGAATWGNGNGGTTGAVSKSNSLTGASAEQVASGGYDAQAVVALTNGNYVVVSPNVGIVNFGAVTWGNGTTGTTGTVTEANSLFGSAPADQVGFGGVTALTNGNYVVASPLWAADRGAVTWATGTAPTTSEVSVENSLISIRGARTGLGGITALTNGNYVVATPDWTDGTMLERGAVTWGNGTTGATGLIDATNSLVGSNSDEYLGYHPAVALTNGNYVVADPGWANSGTLQAGAVTWGNGEGGTVGAISPSNSLIGTTEQQLVGGGSITPLTNGNYAVWSPTHSPNFGSVTWATGSAPTSAVVDPANSFYGTAEYGPDSNAVTATADGGYLVVSAKLRSNSYAITPLDGTGPTSATPTIDNSLFGPGQAANVYSLDAAHRLLIVKEELLNTVAIVSLTTPATAPAPPDSSPPLLPATPGSPPFPPANGTKPPHSDLTQIRGPASDSDENGLRSAIRQGSTSSAD